MSRAAKTAMDSQTGRGFAGAIAAGAICRSNSRRRRYGKNSFSAAAMALVSAIWCVDACSSAIAQEVKSSDKFVWRIDKSTGTEIAASRSNASFNFFDIGSFSPYSLSLVKEDLARISKASGGTIDRGLSSSIIIIHDESVFSRLKNDRRSFTVLGMSDGLIEALLGRITDDSPKCLTMSVTDDQNDIYLTVILLAVQSDDCLVRGLLDSFGIRASDVDTQTLIDVCVLYEGRRRGLRDRQSLSQESSRLRDACLANAGEQK